MTPLDNRTYIRILATQTEEGKGQSLEVIKGRTTSTPRQPNFPSRSGTILGDMNIVNFGIDPWESFNLHFSE